jgi:hypothetical protein
MLSWRKMWSNTIYSKYVSCFAITTSTKKIAICHTILLITLVVICTLTYLWKIIKLIVKVKKDQVLLHKTSNLRYVAKHWKDFEKKNCWIWKHTYK